MNKKKFTVNLFINFLLLFVLHFFNIQRFVPPDTFTETALAALVSAVINLVIFLIIGTIAWGLARLILRRRSMSLQIMATWTAHILLAIEVLYVIFFLR